VQTFIIRSLNFKSMKESIQKLEQLLSSASDYFRNTAEETLTYKSAEASWSKKEILGHLIDSGINNLQRFTEIQFSDIPFPIHRYGQNELVKVNRYNSAATDEILSCWLALNERIKAVMEVQTAETLAYEIILYDGKERSDLRYLMTDYVEHMGHHLKKIFE
jgi:hypothetical protein